MIGLLIFGLLIAVVVLIANQNHLKKRLDHIERYLADATKETGTATAGEGAEGNVRPKLQTITPESQMIALEAAPTLTQFDEEAAAKVERMVVHQAAPQSEPQAQEESGPDVMERFFAWCREDWLLKTGAFLFFLGCVWFVSYAFVQGWIGPVGRIMLGIVFGLALMGFGYARLVVSRLNDQAEVFLALGSLVVLSSLYAAQVVYGLFSPAAMFVSMFGVIVVVSALAALHQLKALAYLSLLFAFLIPLVTDTPEPSFILLMSYLALVVMGSVAVAWVRGWHSLLPLSLFGVFFHSMLWVSHLEALGIENTALWVAFAFGALFVVVSTSTFLRFQLSKEQSLQYIFTVAGAALYVLLWILGSAEEGMRAVYYVAWTALFALGAVVLRQHSGYSAPYFSYLAITGVFAAAATVALFDGPILTLVVLAEVVSVLVLIHGLVCDGQKTSLASYLFVWPVLLTLPSLFSDAWETGVVHTDSVVVVALMVALVGCALFIYRFPAQRNPLPAKAAAASLLVVAYLVLLVFTERVFGTFGVAILTQVYTLEAVLCVLVVAQISGRLLSVQYSAWVLLLPALLSLGTMSKGSWDGQLLSDDFFTLLLLAVAFFYLAYRVYIPQPVGEPAPEIVAQRGLSGVLAIFGTVYSFILVWLFFHVALPGNQDRATMLSLLFYTIVGVSAYVGGVINGHPHIRYFGGIIVALVIGRLLLIDVWSMELLGRVMTFLVIGLLLMSTAFLRLGKVSQKPR